MKSAPSSAYKQNNGTTETVELQNKELTYYVYPVYYVNLPSYSEITAEQILYNVWGNNLKASSLDVLSDNEYKNDGKTLEALFTEFNTAVTTAGSKPTAEQTAAIKAVVNKIASATKDGKSIASVIVEQYRENIFHGLEDAYNTHITDAIDKEVMNLINNSVVIKSYPEKLLKEFKDTLYESHEYDFYKGTLGTDKTITNYSYYNGDLDLFLVKTLGLNDISELDAVLTAEAKKYIDPMIKIYVISQAIAPDALKVMGDYIEGDIKNGMYGEVDAKALKNIRSWADKFVVDDAYMKQYKKMVGSAVYRNEISTYGELNLRTAKQFENLFYYLTSLDATYDADGHSHPNYVDGKLAYRTIKYDFK